MITKLTWNLWDAAKDLLRGKCVFSNQYTRKEEWLSI